MEVRDALNTEARVKYGCALSDSGVLLAGIWLAGSVLVNKLHNDLTGILV